jgi:hypothetical protein
MNFRRLAACTWIAFAAACTPTRVAVPAAPEPSPSPPLPAATVWNRSAGADLVGDSTRSRLPRVAMRLEVLEADSASLRVRCAACGGAEGWIAQEQVVWRAASPAEAARGELAEFVLAVRGAAAARDVAALRPAMSRQFVHSLGGGDGIVEAVSGWERGNYQTLDPLPSLLDGGVAPYGDVWVAPAEHLEQRAYGGLRTGFRRENGVWRWMFLVRDGR